MSKNVTDGNTIKKEQFHWTSQMDDAFIQAMLKEQDKGNRVDGTFTSEAYANMVDVLSKTLNKDFNKKHLKNRLKTLKYHFSQCYDVFRGVSLSGFAWNSETKLFEAEEEVWEALIAVCVLTNLVYNIHRLLSLILQLFVFNRKSPMLQNGKGKISNYDEMLELFGRDRATGGAAETAKERRNQMNANKQIPETIDEIDHMVSIDEIRLENVNSSDDIQITSPMPASQMNQSEVTTSKNKKRKVDEEDVTTVKITASIDNVANAIRKSIFERSHPPLYSAKEIFDELQMMGVEPVKISRAYLFLVDKPNKVRALFGCHLPMRMSILKDMMDADS
ncbi:hypothetical protein OSB04_024486 [Centaurea solstitialis]|uniref:Myb/SANT-like domain-containing protein n=1 Tax=Centaurea solstitialis TaxID=347529 RepID=A0AA38SMU8_9ASTR|nr:hypothetical protein OSB04_024486 [Centaurea solstitialis]